MCRAMPCSARALKVNQPRSQGLFPDLVAGREKALASAGHVPTYTLKSWL